LCQQEKPSAEDEIKESSLVNSAAPLYDTASSGDSSGLKQYTASTGQNLYAESNTGFSPASTEDIDISALTASVESELATEKVSYLIYLMISSIVIIFFEQQINAVYMKTGSPR